MHALVRIAATTEGQVPYTLRVVEQLRNSTMAITSFKLEPAS